MASPKRSRGAAVREGRCGLSSSLGLPPSRGRTFGVLLAAGSSSRWPGGPKLLAQFEGRTLLRRACDALQTSRVDGAIAVLGADADLLGPECELAGMPTVHNPDFERGQSTSLRLGVGSAPASAAGFLLTVADQPLLTAEHLDRVIEMGEQTDRITCVRAGGLRGAPAWFPARMRAELSSIKGDRGARGLITDDVAPAVVDLPDEVLFDVDRPSDLERLIETKADGR